MVVVVLPVDVAVVIVYTDVAEVDMVVGTIVPISIRAHVMWKDKDLPATTVVVAVLETVLETVEVLVLAVMTLERLLMKLLAAGLSDVVVAEAAGAEEELLLAATYVVVVVFVVSVVVNGMTETVAVVVAEGV